MRPGIRYVRLVGPEGQLEELRQVLQDSSIEVVEDKGQVLIHDPRLQTADSWEDAAAEVVLEIQAAFQLATGRLLDIDPDTFVRVDETGARTVHVFANATVTMSAAASVVATSADGTTQTWKPTDPIPGWLDALKQHPHLARAMRALAREGNTWVGLYKVHDALEQHAGNLADLDVASVAQLKRFTKTANNYDLVGDDARHSKTTNKPLKDPMTLAEARALIHGLLAVCLRDA